MKLFGRRRQLIVDSLQLKLLAINLAYSCAMVALFVVIIFGPPILTTLDESASVERKLAAADRMLLLHKSTWPAVVILGVLFGLHSLLYSHRIAGPLFGFRRVFDRVGGGDLTARARIRTKDYLEDDCRAINRMIEGLAVRMSAVRQAADALNVNSTDFEQVCRSTSGQGPRPAQALAARLEALQHAIDAYRLPDLPDAEMPDPADTAPDRELVHS